MKPKPNQVYPIDREPTDAELRYAGLAMQALALLPRIEKGLNPGKRVNWGHVGSAQDVIEHLVLAAFALGQITEDEARDQYGVRL